MSFNFHVLSLRFPYYTPPSSIPAVAASPVTSPGGESDLRPQGPVFPMDMPTKNSQNQQV